MKNQISTPTTANRVIERNLSVGVPYGYDDTEAMALPKPTIDIKNNVVNLSAPAGYDIRYTINGNDPTKTSTKYTTPFTLQQTATVKAVCVKNNVLSPVSAQSYRLMPVCATPTITLNEAGDIVLATSTEGAKIVFEINGDMPNGKSATYSEPISYDRTICIKALAVKHGAVDSEIASAIETYEGEAEIGVLHNGEVVNFGRLRSLTIGSIEGNATINFSTFSDEATEIDIPAIFATTPELAVAKNYTLTIADGVAVLNER